MGSTAGALPYPEPTEPLADGALNIKALADAVTDRIAMGQCGGFIIINPIGANATGSVTVTFPAGRFTVAPVVNVTVSITAPANRAVATGTPTTSSCILYCQNNTAASGSGSLRWFAHQSVGMTTAAALDAAARVEGETFGTVVCPTSGCENAGVPLEVQTGYVDDDGQPQQVGAIVCGVCGTELVHDPAPF